MSTRTTIETTAREHGWTQDPGDPGLFSRGTRHVHVVYSVRGTVTLAATTTRRFDGLGKAARVLSELAR